MTADVYLSNTDQIPQVWELQDRLFSTSPPSVLSAEAHRKHDHQNFYNLTNKNRDEPKAAD